MGDKAMREENSSKVKIQMPRFLVLDAIAFSTWELKELTMKSVVGGRIIGMTQEGKEYDKEYSACYLDSKENRELLAKIIEAQKVKWKHFWEEDAPIVAMKNNLVLAFPLVESKVEMKVKN